MVGAGWGTAIGGLVGAIGGGILGASSGGKKEFCQEIESCEDINM
jgi:outer membrane lipoprotein SlyB